MKQKKNIINQREEAIKKSLEFNLLSDVFMSVALQDKGACQHVLRTLTSIEDLEVLEVKTQYTISKIRSHGARLDVVATDSRGKIYNIEVQRKGSLDHAKRARFYSSMIDSEFLEKGKEYEELPDVYIIYISEQDIWKAGKTKYLVEKIFHNTDIKYNDGVHILYVNAAIDDVSDIASLMKYFVISDPSDNSQGELSKRVHFLKCEEGGNEIMCEVTEKFIEWGLELGIEQGIEQGKEQGIKLGKKQGIKLGKEQGIELGKEQGIKQSQLKIIYSSIKEGLPIDLIARITGLTQEEIKEIIKSNRTSSV